MSDKLTQKQQLFTLNLFEGMSQRESYIKAGYSPNQSPATIDRHACELAKSDKVLARLGELQEAAKDASVANVLERKQVLTEIIRGRFVDFMTKLTPEKLKSAALQEIRITEFSGGKNGRAKEKTTTIKLNDPVKAIAELNKMEHIYELAESGDVNIYNQTLNIGIYNDLKNYTDEQLLAIISRNGGRGASKKKKSPE